MSAPSTRRDLMGAGLFIALAGVAAVAVAKPEHAIATDTDPDAELLALCGQFDALERQANALWYGSTRIEDDDERDAALEPIKNGQSAVLDRITVTRARTLDGIRAKARSLDLWDTDRETCETEGYHNDRLIASIMRDLVGEGVHG